MDKDVQKDKKLVSYSIVDKATKPYVEVVVGGETKTFSPEEVSAMILVKMKETAEAFLGKTVKHAVVTVPGGYDAFYIVVFFQHYPLFLLQFLWFEML